MKIIDIKAREILDSRGNPTVSTSVFLDNGIVAEASVPSGASTGLHEAVELRDDNPFRFNGKGVLKAVANIENEINLALLGQDVTSQAEIDNLMIALDGTPNKSRLGANAILSVSLAVSRAGALSLNMPLYIYLANLYGSKEKMCLPIPLVNLINGGRHASFSTDIQEYMIIPKARASFADSLEVTAEIYAKAKEMLEAKHQSIALGDEGGFVLNVSTNKDPFLFLEEVIANTNYVLGKDVFFGIDVASSEFFRDGVYHLSKENKICDSSQLKIFYENLIKSYPLVSIEDPFAEDKWEENADFTKSFGKMMQIVGDDIFATNKDRIEKGLKQKVANAVLIKPNQIGTLTETMEAVKCARLNRAEIVISHRSGETEDSYIADLAVALGAGQIKTGAPARGERIAKYNRLLKIEEESGLPCLSPWYLNN